MVLPQPKSQKTEDAKEILIRTLINELKISENDAKSLAEQSTDVETCRKLFETRTENRSIAEKISADALSAYNILISVFSDKSSLVFVKNGINTTDKAHKAVIAKQRRNAEIEQEKEEKAEKEERERIDRERTMREIKEEAKRAELEKYKKEKEKQDILNRIKMDRMRKEVKEEPIARPSPLPQNTQNKSQIRGKCKIQLYYEKQKPFVYQHNLSDNIGMMIDAFRKDANIADNCVIKFKNSMTNKELEYTYESTFSDLGIKGLDRYFVTVEENENSNDESDNDDVL